MKWISPRRLRELGVLGINARNRDYVAAHNPRRMFPLVDDKLQTKRLLQEAGLAAPSLLFTIDSQHAINGLEARLRPHQVFCVKPAKGSGGKGILVVTGRSDSSAGGFVKGSGQVIDLGHIQRHMSNTLAGLYSLGGNPDTVIVEELIEFDPVFEGYSYQGVPDIRVIVFHGYPVMAMLRLATRASDGKANLHQGAIGVGIDLATGRSVQAVQYAHPVVQHPDTGQDLDAIEIADWHSMLVLAARCFDITGLGYLGTDLVLDRVRGAQLLELNARPGLAIQVANGAGLQPRLRLIAERFARHHESAEDRVAFAMEAFAAGASALSPADPGVAGRVQLIGSSG